MLMLRVVDTNTQLAINHATGTYIAVSQAVLLYSLSDIHHIHTMLVNKQTEDNLNVGNSLNTCRVSLITKNNGVGSITGCYAATVSSALSSAVWQ